MWLLPAALRLGDIGGLPLLSLSPVVAFRVWVDVDVEAVLVVLLVELGGVFLAGLLKRAIRDDIFYFRKLN